MKYYKYDYGAIGAYCFGFSNLIESDSLGNAINEITKKSERLFNHYEYGGFGEASRFEINEISERLYNELSEGNKRFTQ